MGLFCCGQIDFKGVPGLSDYSFEQVYQNRVSFQWRCLKTLVNGMLALTAGFKNERFSQNLGFFSEVGCAENLSVF